ncbi:flippase [Pseudoalteromonas pernae]|uniref:flippase n=1 Tax=Pseudoalteromonas pernae TaxID=3118054 RepID=UPI0032420667
MAAKSFKNTVLLIVERMVMMLFAFSSSIAIARLGGTELFGQYSSITAFASILLPMAILGLNNIATAVFLKSPNYAEPYLITALKVRLIGAVFSIVITSLVAGFFVPDMYFYVVILVALQSFAACYVIEFYFLAQEKVFVTQKVRFLVILSVSTLKIAVAFVQPKLLYFILLTGFENVFIALGYWVCFQRYKKNPLGEITLKREMRIAKILLGRAKWLIISAFSAVMYLKFDQLMLAYFKGHEDVAQYAAAARLSEFWYVFPVLLANVLMAKIHRSRKESEAAYANTLLGFLALMVIISFVVILFTGIFAKPLVSIVYGAHYSAASAILVVHILACLFVFQRAVLSKWIIFENLYRLSAITHGVGALANIALNFWLIPLYGGIGAAWATVLAYGISSFVSLWFFPKARPFARQMIRATVVNIFYWQHIRQLFRN